MKIANQSTWETKFSDVRSSHVEDFYAERAAVLAAEATEWLGANEVLDGDEQRARDALQAIKIAELDAGFNASIYPPAKSFFQSQDRVARFGVMCLKKAL